jgi:PAS domain S-box-containing protein
MHPYVLIPLGASIVAAFAASMIWTPDPEQKANRLAATFVLGTLLWSVCEVLWNTCQNEAFALWLVRISAFGWVWTGPLALHLLLEITGIESPGFSRWLPRLYAAAATFLAIDLCTPWIHPGMLRTSWGFAYRLGPAYLGFYLFTVSALAGAIPLGIRSYGSVMSPAERSQARVITVGIVVPLVVGSLTDGLLPLCNIQLPRLGTASFAFLDVTLAWSFHRFGYSFPAPGAFAREILETLPNGVALLWLDGRVRVVNEGLARLAGTLPERLLGVSVSHLLTFSPAESVRECDNRPCELTHARGHRIPVSVSSAFLRDKQGSPIGLVVVVRDLREVVTLRNRLVTSARRSAIGELAAGIAHEINNPISFIRANLSLLRSHWSALGGLMKDRGDAGSVVELLEEGDELIEECIEGVDRAASFVREVKGFSHAGCGERELVDLNLLLENVLRVAAPQLRHRARIERHFAELPLISCAQQEIKQVLLNVVLNARQALGPEGGEIELGTKVSGSEVVVTVRDDGCGIPAEAVERLFDPFFTTKPGGEGTGLGLVISREIVRRHGGDIRIESALGRGTTVRIRLPIALA